MILKRTAVPSADSGGFVRFEVVVVECEACAFSAVSRFEADAVGIVERHQARCAKFLEQCEKRSSETQAGNDSPPAKQPITPALQGNRK